jgi:hypothetical protein
VAAKREKVSAAKNTRLLREMKKDEPVLAVQFFRLGDKEPVRDSRASRGRCDTGSAGTSRLCSGDGRSASRSWTGSARGSTRSTVDDNIYRVLFCNIQHVMVLLHGFMKKTQRTSKDDLDLARKRQKAAKEALS